MWRSPIYVLASGTFTDRDKLGPLPRSEVAKVHELRDRGVIPGAYRRADGSGVELLPEFWSVEDAREQLSQLPWAKAGSLSFELAELLEPFGQPRRDHGRGAHRRAPRSVGDWLTDNLAASAA